MLHGLWIKDMESTRKALYYLNRPDAAPTQGTNQKMSLIFLKQKMSFGFWFPYSHIPGPEDGRSGRELYIEIMSSGKPYLRFHGFERDVRAKNTMCFVYHFRLLI